MATVEGKGVGASVEGWEGGSELVGSVGKAVVAAAVVVALMAVVTEVPTEAMMEATVEEVVALGSAPGAECPECCRCWLRVACSRPPFSPRPG